MCRSTSENAGGGKGLHSPLLRAVAGGLAEAGHPVVTFNFPAAEAGRRVADPAPRLLAVWSDVLAAAPDLIPGRPIVAGGRSMGGRMASMLLSDPDRVARHPACVGLVLLGYPLHPAGRPERLRTGHWPDLRLPALFVQGERDPLCDLGLFERQRAARLAHVPTSLHVVAGGDHGFGVRRRDGRDSAAVRDEVVGAVVAWLGTLAGGDRAGRPASVTAP
ncbi:MAG: alpha/beta hydrolase [Euzebyaceae bacterium]|nr:alpha/beta hydrolase [Euzebyaceae bacterium]